MISIRPTRVFLTCFAWLLLLPLTTSAEPYKVGLSVPLTGWAATYGSVFQNGLQLFQEENPASSQEIKFIYEDSQYDGPRVVTSVKKLTEIDDVDILFVWGDTPSQISAPLASQLKKPMFTISFDSVAKNRPNVASLTIPLDGYKQIVSNFLAERHWGKIGVLVSNVGATTKFVDLLRPALPPFVFEHSVGTDLQDFNSVVTRIRSKQVDTIFLSLTTEQYPAFKKAAMAQKYKTFLIGGDQLSDQTLRDDLRVASTGIAYLVGQIDKSFSEKYFNRFKNRSRIFEAATGYTVGMIMQRLARQARVEPSVLVAKMPSVSFVESPIGPIMFTQSDDFGVSAKLVPGIQIEE